MIDDGYEFGIEELTKGASGEITKTDRVCRLQPDIEGVEATFFFPYPVYVEGEGISKWAFNPETNQMEYEVIELTHHYRGPDGQLRVSRTGDYPDHAPAPRGRPGAAMDDRQADQAGGRERRGLRSHPLRLRRAEILSVSPGARRPSGRDVADLRSPELLGSGAVRKPEDRTAGVGMNLFQLGLIKLSSGKPSLFKIECDALTPEDWACLAYLGSSLVPKFGEVVGVPNGGLAFAEAMSHFSRRSRWPRPRLVVDDVYTTGGSIRKIMREGDLALVAFARKPLPPDIRAIWTLSVGK
jgi:hypothetical protein